MIAPPLIKKPSTLESSGLDRRVDSGPVTTAPYNNQRDDPKPAIYPGPKKILRRRRNFHWKITGVSPCSKSCGGGEFLNLSQNKIYFSEQIQKINEHKK